MNAFPQTPFPERGPQGLVPRRSRPKRSLWKKITLWTLGSLAALIVLVVAGVFILLHSNRFHAYLLHTGETKASQALGSQVNVGDFSLTLSGLSPGIALHNLVVHGGAPYPNPPLLAADLVRLQITISSLWHLDWYVNDVQIHHPVVRVFADNQGRNNLPHPPSKNSSSGSNFNVFTLGIRHLLLGQGNVYYNNRESKLAADLHDLEFHLGFAPADSKYSGTLSYRNGKVQWQGSNSLPHALDASFSATPQKFTLENAVLNLGRSYVTLEAAIQNYSQPKVHGTYTAVLDGAEFQNVLKNPSVPSGLIYLSGVADYQSEAGRALLASAKLKGELHSAELNMEQQKRRLTIRGLRANYALDNGNASASGIYAELLGGTLNASMAIHDLTGNPQSNLQASLQNISASAIQQMAGPATNRRAVMKGTIDATARANWGKSLDTLVATGALKIAATMQPTNGESATPVNGNIQAHYSAARQQLALGQSYIRTPQTTISLNGTLSNRSTLRVSVDARQLHELDQLAAAFRAPDSPPLGLRGDAHVTATVTGSTRNPNVQGQLTASNLQVHGTAWKSAHAGFEASPSSARVKDGQIVPAGSGSINFRLATGLKQWSFEDSSKFQAQLSASDLKMQEFAKAAGLNTQISGTLSANLQADGTQLSPQG